MNKTLHIGTDLISIQWVNYECIHDDKPILIFLHEALGSIIQWKTFPQTLCTNLQLAGLIIERTGHGNSSGLTGERTTTYLHQYAEETLEVIKACLPSDKRFILVGHSDGGSIALILGAKKLKFLQAVITMAAHTFVEEETLAGIQPAIEAYDAGKLDGLKRIHGEKTETLFFAWANTWLHPDFKNWDIRAEIQSISVPILAIQGILDQYGTEKQVDSIVEISPKNKGIMLPNCGHHPHLEKPIETVSFIEQWLLENVI